MQNKKNLANIHLAWSSITHLRANSEGEGGGGAGDENLLSFPTNTQS